MPVECSRGDHGHQQRAYGPAGAAAIVSGDFVERPLPDRAPLSSHSHSLSLTPFANLVYPLLFSRRDGV